MIINLIKGDEKAAGYTSESVTGISNQYFCNKME